MRPNQISLGMKVVPFQRSIYSKSLKQSAAWQEAQTMKQPFLYVVGFSSSKEHRLNKEGKTEKEETLEYALNTTKVYGGDFFLAADFNPYNEKKVKK